MSRQSARFRLLEVIVNCRGSINNQGSVSSLYRRYTNQLNMNMEPALAPHFPLVRKGCEEVAAKFSEQKLAPIAQAIDSENEFPMVCSSYLK